MKEPLSLVESLMRHDQQRRQKRLGRFFQMNRRTLALLIAGATTVLFAGAWGLWVVVSRLGISAPNWNRGFKQTPADEFLPTICIGSSLLLGVLVALLIYRLRNERGFIVFAGLSCLCLLGLIFAFTIDNASLANTYMNDVTAEQVLRISLFSVAGVLPFSGFVGWYSTVCSGH